MALALAEHFRNGSNSPKRAVASAILAILWFDIPQ
jgi:hypothetical protein